MVRKELYPPIEPHTTGRLRVDPPHALYWEQSGAADGVPVVFLHGGPGAGTAPTHRRFFDPSYYRIILFDQRGAGRSTPRGELAGNTTAHLVADIDQLRRHLGIERWFVFGGSWGSTLALAYAGTHATRCIGLILRGIFLCRQREIDWFLYGMRRIFPEAWRRFADAVPEAERDDLLAAYLRQLSADDPRVHLPAARAWSAYEGACSTLLPSGETLVTFPDDGRALALARIEAQYFAHNAFLPDGDILHALDRIRHIPAVIVQGRYDIVCPIETADDLARAWPEASYVVVPDAGHSALEPGIRGALIAATERFKLIG